MAFKISIDATANQSFTINLDNQVYFIEIKETRGVMSVSISIGGDVILSNSRFFSAFPLIPYSYLEGDGGNFLFTTENDEIPYFTEFGVTQFLYYLTAEELASA